jgi:hypothetical protein
MTASNLELIFEEWRANLKQKDRSAGSVSNNFEELFCELKRANASFDEAHAILPKAIKAHQPPISLAKNIYKNSKSNPKVAGLSEKEFISQWNDDIAAKGTSTFFDNFPRPKNADEDDGEPKIYGQMSAKEYKAQRKYADSFPRLDTEKLERALVSNAYNPMEDLDNILGEKKDGNS